ncbi:hypothetical protein MKW92_050575 [Papaver armeniacum]|nr:hypothetical protein MKW92_050575 [Papaver armeniacum]
MAKTTSLCFAPLFIGLIFISIVMMSSQGVNGETKCQEWPLDYFQTQKKLMFVKLLVKLSPLVF